MAYNESQNKATQKYLAENMKQVRFWVKKDEVEIIKERAKLHGLSLAQYMIKLINDDAGEQVITPSK